MKTIVMSGDETLHLSPLFFKLLAKHLPIEQEVDFLGFSLPKHDRPHFIGGLKINFISLGDQKDFYNPETGFWIWSDAVLPYFERLQEKTFFLTWMEHLPICSADVELFKRLVILVERTRAKKAVCDTHLNTGKFSSENSLIAEDIHELGQATMYRTTLMPSIWEREYFMRYLKPGMTAWDFETKNMQESLTDGAIIIAPAEKNAYTSFNYYLKGFFNQEEFDAIEKDLDSADRRDILDGVNRHGKQTRLR